MNGVLIFARREIVEKKFVFLTALALAVVPFAASLLPMRRIMGTGGVIVGVATVLAVAFTLGLAIALGSSMVSRELAERRLSFYFARPVSAVSIWLGKLGAALFTILVCLAFILVPAMAVGRGEWSAMIGGSKWSTLGVLLGLTVVLLLLSHVISTVIRSRSPLVAIDFLLAAATALAVFYLVRPLFLGLATNLVNRLVFGLLIGFGVAVVAAGAWQLADGRTDRRRSHASMSRVLWSVIGGTLLIAAGFVTWVVSVKPSDVTEDVNFWQAPQGNWSYLTGLAKNRGDYRAGFLYDLASGRSMRVSGGDLIWGGASFNRNGTMSSLQRRVDTQHTQLVLLPLDQPELKPIETDLTLPFFSTHVLSDDSRRVGYIAGGLLGIYDVPTKRNLVSVRLPKYSMPRMFFPSPDVVRVYLGTLGENPAERVIDVYELDVRTRALVRTGGLRAPASILHITLSRDGSVAVVRSFVRGGATAVFIADPRTLAPIAEYKPAPDVRIGAFAPLADGTVLIGETRGNQGFARVVRRDGSLVREVPLGAGHVYFSAELPENRVVLATATDLTDMRSGKQWTTLVVDLGRGVIERRASDLLPEILSSFSSHADPRRGDPAQRLIGGIDENHALVTWDPATGEKKTIAKG